MAILEASLLFIALFFSSPTAHAAQRFKEAPEFHNAATCSPSLPVHVAMTVNSRYLRGSMAAILSILRHSDCPENLRFHFITPESSSELINTTITTSFPYLHVAVYPFSSSTISGRISSSIRAALDSPSNYARNYIADLLPVEKVVYLDSDVILVDDIATLYNHPIDQRSVIAAPEYCKTNITSYFTPTFWANPSLASAFSDRNPCYFNTGVMVIDLVKWREGDYTTQIVEWMELQKRMRIYELGSLPPLMLVFGGRISAVDHRWNKHGLGGDNYKGLCREMHPGPVSLLHWSGKGKPWVRIDEGRPCPLDALWAPYDLLDNDQPLISSF